MWKKQPKTNSQTQGALPPAPPGVYRFGSHRRQGVCAVPPPPVLRGKRAELATARERAGVGVFFLNSRSRFSNLDSTQNARPSGPPLNGMIENRAPLFSREAMAS